MRAAVCILLILLAPAILTAQFDPSNPVFLGLLNRPVATGGGGPTTLIHDTFSGTGGSSMSGRTPDTVNTPGNTWSVSAGTWTVDGSGNAEGNGSGSAPWNRVVIESGVSDCTVFTVGVFGATASTMTGGLMVRTSNASNGWIVRGTKTSPQFRLIRREAGAETEEATAATVAIATGDVVAFWVTLNGTSIAAAMTNLTTGLGTNLTFTSSFNQTTTTHGLVSRGTAYLTEYQEFTVQTP